LEVNDLLSVYYENLIFLNFSIFLNSERRNITTVGKQPIASSTTTLLGCLKKQTRSMQTKIVLHPTLRTLWSLPNQIQNLRTKENEKPSREQCKIITTFFFYDVIVDVLRGTFCQLIFPLIMHTQKNEILANFPLEEFLLNICLSVGVNHVISLKMEFNTFFDHPHIWLLLNVICVNKQKASTLHFLCNYKWVYRIVRL